MPAEKYTENACGQIHGKSPADKYTENACGQPADNLRTKTVHARAENIADTDLAILNFIVIYNKVTLWIELQLLMN